MRLSAFLAGAAAALWALALLPGPALGGGEEWLLVDASRSAGGPEAAARRLAATQIPGPRRFVFASGLAPGDGPAGAWPDPGESRLGAALAALRPRLRPGDRLRVVSDGRATDLLPAPGDWAGVHVLWERLPPRPRIAGLSGPVSWPARGAVEVRVRLADADPAAGHLEVAAPPDFLAAAAGVRPEAEGLTVTLRARRPPAAPVRLRFCWRQGEARSCRDLVLPPPETLLAAAGAELAPVLASLPGVVVASLPLEGPGLVLAAPDALSPAALRAELDEGRVVLLAAPRAAAWLALPADLRPLDPDPAPGTGLVLLLDRSGSMAEAGRLDAARRAVLAWAAAWPREHRFQVLPFARDVEAPLDPREPGGRARLEALLPHGGTDLAGALAAASGALRPGDVLVVASDARSPAPPEGWAALGRALAAQGLRVLCVPPGPGADRQVLAALGRVEEGSAGLDRRLLEALAEAEGEARGPGRAVPGVPWTLPAVLEAPSPRQRFRAAPGAMPLLRGADGAVLLAALPRGRGWLLGLAARPSREVLGALLPTVREAVGAPRLWRDGDTLWLRAESGGWRARVLQAGVWRPLDPVEEGLSWARPLDPAGALEVEDPDGRRLHWPPGAREEDAPPEPWEAWLEEQAALATREATGPAVPLLVLALLAAVASLGVKAGGRDPRLFPGPARGLSSLS